MMPQVYEISIDVDVLTEKQLRPERGEVGQELAEVKGGVGQTLPLAFGEGLQLPTLRRRHLYSTRRG